MRMRRGVLGIALGVLFVVLLVPETARAQVHELKHDVATDLVVTATAMTLIVGAELAKPGLALPRCKWCDREEDGSDGLNGVDRGVRSALEWNDTLTAARAADGMAFLAAPAVAWVGLTAAAANDRTGDKAPVDILLSAEALGVAGVLNEVVKFSVSRERPFVHALSPADKAKTPHPSDNNLSFYSGHTGLTFNLATSSGTIASLRGYRLAPVVWASTLTIAATTGYLRIAADKHYFTDVIVGMLVGGAIGAAVPLLFHGRRAEETHVPVPIHGTTLGAAMPVTLGGAF
jgi:membrane-associated phospholipid phosphatase